MIEKSFYLTPEMIKETHTFTWLTLISFFTFYSLVTEYLNEHHETTITKQMF